MNEGWICPRCQTVHAPTVKNCECMPLADAISRERYISPVPPMPICGCTGPCGNAACPHMLIVTCSAKGQAGWSVA